MNEIHSNSRSAQTTSEQMVMQQVRTWEVLDDDVLDVMQSVPREMFLSDKFAAFAHTDCAFQIRDNFLLPPPSVQGKILQALSIESDDSILQIGAGSGYLSACLAELGGFVYVVDEDQDALNELKQINQTINIANVNTVTHSFDTLLTEIDKQYDAIVMQHALKSIPTEIKQALRENGVAVLFIGSAPIIHCVRIERIAENEWIKEELFETVVADLPNGNKNKDSVTFSF